LCGLKEVKVCTEYQLNDTKYVIMPDDSTITEKVKPLYKIFNGWNNITDVNCKIYMDYLCSEVKKCGCSVGGFGTGPYTNDILLV
jgi:adenylosuccinate synthase